MVNVAPEAKLTAVRDVPTELPAWNNSIPETTPVNSLPSPLNLVAVTTPANVVSPFALIVHPTPAAPN